MTLVSAIIPTTRRHDLVVRAIASVQAQTHAELEIIVVVDGDNPQTDAVLAALDEPRLRVLHNPPPHGAGAARNFAAGQARGEWLAFLDDDDEWLPEKLARQLAAAPATPSLLSCRTEVVTPHGTDIWPRTPYHGTEPVGDYLFDRRTLLRGGAHVGTSSFLLPASLFAATRFGTSRQNEDTTLLLRVTRQAGANLVMVPEVLLRQYKDEPRESLGNQFDWREMLAWADAHAGLLSRRAYAGFCLIYLGSQAARVGDYHAVPVLLGRAFGRGRPRLIQLLLFAAFFAVPIGLRQRVRGALRRTPEPAPC